MSEFSIEHIAKLANLAISDEEKKSLEKDLGLILEMVEEIQVVDVGEGALVPSVNGLSNVVREDVIDVSLDPKRVLAEAPSANAGYVKVPKVFD